MLGHVQNQKAESQGPKAAEIKTSDEIHCPFLSLKEAFFFVCVRESTGVYPCTELHTSAAGVTKSRNDSQ